MYDRAFRRWKEFALSKHELSYLSANPMHVAVYLQYVLESTRSSSSVHTAFYSIKWAHESAGLVSPTDNPLVNRVRKAAKRILGVRGVIGKNLCLLKSSKILSLPLICLILFS
ncbi:unnamed protein product [Porites lobata]|uniref:Uncharacterized protein n=1 Tax=Porites lobata TaxID=104759 RepID=A0ABN8P498_9CNID|nr:unnamed protein product [Porites lobata]